VESNGVDSVVVLALIVVVVALPATWATGRLRPPAEAALADAGPVATTAPEAGSVKAPTSSA